MKSFAPGVDPVAPLISCTLKGISLSTDAQITANQANAQQSTGPRTEKGKAESSKNNLKFGFTVQFTVQEVSFDLEHLTVAEEREKKLALYLRHQTTHERAFERCANELRKLRNESPKSKIGFAS